MEKQGEKTEEELLHEFDQTNTKPMFSKNVIIMLVLVAVLGISTGYMLAKNGTKGKAITAQTDSSSVEKGTIVGSNDASTFKDTAEGILKKGGIEGEGQYHLVRPGGESQNVYMTSSSVDLSQFLEKKVKVWGQTNTAKTAGWLMDVGKLEVLN